MLAQKSFKLRGSKMLFYTFSLGEKDNFGGHVAPHPDPMPPFKMQS